MPALVADLTAERTGNRVTLRWTTPARTTDDLPVKGAMTAQICREAGSRPAAPTARLAGCTPVLRLAVAPGPSQVTDSLPPGLCSDPVALLTYRIQILNSAERSAGDSGAAFAAAGLAPQPVDSLNVTASEHGAVLEWAATAKPLGGLVELTRTDLSAPPARPAKSSKAPAPPHRSRVKSATPAKSPDSSGKIHLRAPEPPSGLTDTTAEFDKTYMYIAERVRPVGIGQHSLEVRSEPASPATITMRDTFAPRPAAGLATVPGRRNAVAYVDLSWEPNSETDLAGYLVYRQPAGPSGTPQGPAARLTPSPDTAPAFRDVAVSPGQRYIYWVTAVDASGNESAPSAKAQEVVTPE